MELNTAQEAKVVEVTPGDQGRDMKTRRWKGRTDGP